jgi:ABC-2 type transport system permease protein
MKWPDFHPMNTIIRREYMERVRSRTFVLMTILIPVLMAGSMLLPLLMARDDPSAAWTLAVVDETGALSDRIQAALFFDDATEDQSCTVTRVEADGLSEAVDLVRYGAYESLLHIPIDVFTGGKSTFIVNGLPRTGEYRRIRALLSREITRARLWELGLDDEQIAEATQTVKVEPLVVSDTGDGQSMHAALLGTTLMAMFMYFALVIYGSWTMRGVIRDKTSRIVEILVSTTTPTELMAGKIIGIGSVGLTQVGIWIAAALATAAIAPDTAVGRYIDALSGAGLPAFVLYYIFGFLLFGTLYAGVGAMCATEDDATQLQWPIVLLLMVPIFLMGPAVTTPDRPLIVILSYVPFFSPVLMLPRLLTGAVGWLQVAISLAGMVSGSVLLAWVAGKVFRAGILMTGRRMQIRDILRFLREA